jgi:hypothetical protein
VVGEVLGIINFSSASIGATGMGHYKISGSHGKNVGHIDTVFSKCGIKI